MSFRLEGLYPSICEANESGFCNAPKETGKIPSKARPTRGVNRFACMGSDYALSREETFAIQNSCDGCGFNEPNKVIDPMKVIEVFPIKVDK